MLYPQTLYEDNEKPPKNGEEIEKYIARMTHFIYRIHTYTHYTVIKWPQSVLSNGS